MGGPSILTALCSAGRNTGAPRARPCAWLYGCAGTPCSSRRWADSVGLLEPEQKCPGGNGICISWLLLLNKRGRLVSAPFKTKPGAFAKWEKEKICRTQTSKALLLVCCLSLDPGFSKQVHFPGMQMFPSHTAVFGPAVQAEAARPLGVLHPCRPGHHPILRNT